MSITMRAAVYLGPEQIEIRSIPIPEPGPGQLLVKIQAATTCGTDVKTYRRGHPKFPPPFIFGHEFGGDIVQVGKGVDQFREGMRVTANVFAECGQCFFCQRGQGNLCENLVYNFGAFAEYMIIPASIVKRTTFQIPDHIPYAHAALVEPLVTVVHAMNKASIGPGSSVAIVGAGGPISLLFIQLAKRAGAEPIIAIGHSKYRLEIAQTCGATHIINAKESDPIQAVRALTNGYGTDVVIECAGTQQTWESSVELSRRGGRVLWFGGTPTGTKVSIDAVRVHYGEIQLLNMHGGTTIDAIEAFELISSGQLKLAPLLSGSLPLAEIELAIQKMIAGEVVKMVILPHLENARNSVDSLVF